MIIDQSSMSLLYVKEFVLTSSTKLKKVFSNLEQFFDLITIFENNTIVGYQGMLGGGGIGAVQAF